MRILFVSSCCLKKIPQFGQVKQQKFIFSQFWCWPIRSLVRIFFQAYRWLLSQCVLLTWQRKRALVSLRLPIRIPVLSDQGPMLMTSVNLDMNWYNHLGRLVNSIYIKLNTIISDHLAISLLSIYMLKMYTYVHLNTSTKICIAVLFMITLNYKLSKCLLEVKWINKLWHFHPMGHYTPVRINDPQLNPRIWINITNMMLRERRQIQKSAF